MNITILEEKGLVRTLELTMSFEELQPTIEEGLVKAQADAQLDGFRRGKVPMNIIRARFGKAIEREAVQDGANEALQIAVRDHQLEFVGIPQLVKTERTDDNGAKYTLVVEVAPNVELIDYSTITLKKPSYTVNDEELEQEMKRVLLSGAQLEAADVITDTMYVVTAKFSEIDSQSGTPLLGGKDRQIFLENPEVDTILRNDLLNLKVGDSFRYTEDHAANAHDGENGDHAHTHDYLVTVTAIQKVLLPELTSEFISTLTGGKIDNEEDLRKDIRQSLERHYQNETTELLRNNLIDQMITAHPFELPKGVVAMTARDIIEDMRKKNANDKDLKRTNDEQLLPYVLPQAQGTVHWTFIREAIIKQENLTVADEDLQKVADSIGIDIEQIRSAMTQNTEIEGRIITDKVFDFLLERVTIEDVTSEEYEEYMNSLNSTMAELPSTQE